MLTCRKIYADIPFAHRQHSHEGHCRFIHGHNWSIHFTFGCRQLDANGFVLDFGKLRFLKTWIEENLDHACLLNKEDPLREALTSNTAEAWKLYVLENCSSEGIARHLYEVLDPLVREKTEERAFLVEVGVEEDSKNAAFYRPDRKEGESA